MGSYPYHRKSALEERDPEAYALFVTVCDKLHELRWAVREKPYKHFAKKCGVVLLQAFPWLAADQIKTLTDSFGMYETRSGQAAGLYCALNDHWTLSQPITPESLTEALNRPDEWPPGMDGGMYRDGYASDIDGPKPLRDLSDLQCYLVERRDALMMERIDVPGATDAIEDAKSWLTLWDHGYPTDSSWTTPTTRSKARDALNRIRQFVENLLAPTGAKPSTVEPVASPVADDDDKPDGMPSGERQILMENVIWMMGFRGIKTENTKLKGARLATFIEPKQKYNSALKAVLRQLRLPPYELLSPASGHGYFLNPKGVLVYQQLQKDRSKKSPQKMRSH